MGGSSLLEETKEGGGTGQSAGAGCSSSNGLETGCGASSYLLGFSPLLCGAPPVDVFALPLLFLFPLFSGNIFPTLFLLFAANLVGIWRKSGGFFWNLGGFLSFNLVVWFGCSVRLLDTG